MANNPLDAPAREFSVRRLLDCAVVDVHHVDGPRIA
jgi:hypothetical protein